MFVEMPSRVVSPSINEMDIADEIGNVSIASFHDGPEDDILRDVRYYTSRIHIYFNNDVTYGHTTPIVLPRDPAIAEITRKIPGLPQADVLAGYETPRASAAGVGGQ